MAGALNASIVYATGVGPLWSIRLSYVAEGEGRLSTSGGPVWCIIRPGHSRNSDEYVLRRPVLKHAGWVLAIPGPHSLTRPNGKRQVLGIANGGAGLQVSLCAKFRGLPCRHRCLQKS